METLIEILGTQHQNLMKYDRILSANELTIEEVGKLSPFIFHYNDADFNFHFLNEKGCDWFCLSNEQIIEMGSGFIQKYYHPDTIERELPKIRDLYKRNDCESVYFNYHQIFNPTLQAFTVCLSFIKKCNCLSGFISITQTIESNLVISKKIDRLISEEQFRKSHVREIEYLTEREFQILKLLAAGMNNPQISELLFISRRTVEQHRKNINRKLNVHTYRDIMAYAYAFDLV